MLQIQGEFDLCPNVIIDLHWIRYADKFLQVNSRLITELTVKGHPFNVRPPTPVFNPEKGEEREFIETKKDGCSKTSSCSN